MITELYAIRDAITGFKETIITALNEAEATRMFENMAKTPGTIVHEFAKDMDLYRLGTMETKTGKIETPESGPVFIVNALVIKKEEQNGKDTRDASRAEDK